MSWQAAALNRWLRLTEKPFLTNAQSAVDLRLATGLRARDVSVDVVVAQDLPHVWPIFHNILPEGGHAG